MEFWSQKKVLVTGATGLVGGWLVHSLLEKAAAVIAFVRDPNLQSLFFSIADWKKTSLIHGSLEEFSDIERAINKWEIDTVFHLGAQTIVGTALRNPLSTFESNIRGTYNLLEACRRHSNLVERIVIASSDKAYGSSEILPYLETMPLSGKHPYDVSKSCTDLISLSYYHTYSLPITIARCGNIYGGGDLNWSRLIPGTIRSFLLNETPIIRSDGTFTRDYIYVEDVVDAYLSLAENIHRPEIKGQPFNFGLDGPYTVLQVVELLQELMDCPDLPPKILNSSNAEIRDQSLNSKKAKDLLRWQPFYSLEDGFKKTISWYQSYFSTQSNNLCLSLTKDKEETYLGQ